VDDPLALLCMQNDVACFRGASTTCWTVSIRPARPHLPEHVVRLTGIAPLADPALIDHVVGTHVAGGFDYTSNTIPDVSRRAGHRVIRSTCLEEAWREAELPSEREHVTPFLYGGRSVIGSARLGTRWICPPCDGPSMNRRFRARQDHLRGLYPGNPAFTTEDILALLERTPALKTWNVRHARNEGYEKSLKEDGTFNSGKG